MRLECTQIFLHYREIARLVWNLGFLPNPKLREWDSAQLYDEAMARLFEGIVLGALGYEGHVEDKHSPGKAANFQVECKYDMELRVDANRPEDPSHIWGDPVLRLGPEDAGARLRFVKFFDWDLLGSRDFRLLETLVEKLDHHPELVGRHALVDLQGCSIWMVDEEGQKK